MIKDFLIKESNKIKELIQVCYANSYEEVPRRERGKKEK
jgi:hypothetical protein